MFDQSELSSLITRVGNHDGKGLSESALIDHIEAFEQLKAAASAAQAKITVTLVATRTAREAAENVPARKRCQGLAAEIALARHESPSRGARCLGLAKALVQEMPNTLAALSRGEISEWRATIMVRETAVLASEDRAQVDTDLADHLATLGDRELAAEARMAGYRLDPGSVTRRTRGANADRYVSVRPAPDTMTYFTGFLPVAQGVACQVALQRHADARRSEGDTRTRGQIMADTLVERITGQATAEAVNVEIALVMTDQALLSDDHSTAEIIGYGPIPSSAARDLVLDAATAWVRRLYADPAGGSLVAMDSRQRLFTGQLRQFLIIRDRKCRTPWCEAPIRHADHIDRAADSGETSAENGAGLCESCNYTKEARGWQTTRAPGRGHRIRITTPTGRVYESVAPGVVG